MARIDTPLKEQVLALLAEHHLLTGPELIDTLNISGNTYNKTSVYRVLEKLLTEEKICKLNFGGNEISYELRDSHHDHVVCTSCGKVVAVECQNISMPDNDFLIDHHHLTFFGHCPKCQTKAQQAQARS